MEQNKKYLYALMGGHPCTDIVQDGHPRTDINQSGHPCTDIWQGGHLRTDISQGALSAELPLLVMYDGFSYAKVSLFIFGLAIISAIVQPLLGVLGDCKARPQFMALGVFLASLGMFGIGLVPNLHIIVPSTIVNDT